MSLSKEITIAVLTYKRKKELNICLSSLLIQKNKFKILLIDNDFEKSAFEIFLKFRNRVNIKYFNEPLKNISRARNLAINNCKTKYLAFIDDDCVLSYNWSEWAEKVINNNKRSVFFQGRSISKYLKNPVVLAQNNILKSWINNNIKDSLIDPRALDTKNIILNLEIINKYQISFDENFPIFEDVDLGLQIKKYKLEGNYVPEMLVEHLEISGFKKVIEKFYFRGKIKYILNKKWGNFDNFLPNFFNDIKNIIKYPKDIYQNIFNLSFNLGFKIAKLQNFSLTLNKVFIINCLDKGANEERAVKLKYFLENNGFIVEIIDSKKEFDKTINNFRNVLISPYYFLTYRFFRFLIYHTKFTFLKDFFKYIEIIIKGKIMRKILINKKAKIVIVQYPEDLFVARKPRPFKVIMDIPTIYSEEIENKKISELEKIIFNESDATCFHWYSFLELTKKYGLKLKNIFVLNWGCDKQNVYSKYSTNPKIIYLGKLNSDWINPELLEKIQSRFSSLIDIYSYEIPSKSFYKSIKTKGFMKNLDNISNYQFGLITFTDDQLRNDGFSAKHLKYISYGLPVLCPEWRKDKLLAPATIYYNENNFDQQLNKFSKKIFWLKKHKAALELAKKMNWNETLKPILPIIYKLKNEN